MATFDGRQVQFGALIVVGAHLSAERHDRATAYRLAERVDEVLRARGEQGRGGALVCSDLWWLNDQSLRETPTISIGAPEVNALTAYLADKLPSAFAIDGRLIVQLDVERGDALAACWGVTHEETARAVGVFIEKYLEGWVGG